jgi:hypothetical protein
MWPLLVDEVGHDRSLFRCLCPPARQKRGDGGIATSG